MKTTKKPKKVVSKNQEQFELALEQEYSARYEELELKHQYFHEFLYKNSKSCENDVHYSSY